MTSHSDVSEMASSVFPRETHYSAFRSGGRHASFRRLSRYAFTLQPNPAEAVRSPVTVGRICLDREGVPTFGGSLSLALGALNRGAKR